jgi:hypothetical protein
MTSPQDVTIERLTPSLLNEWEQVVEQASNGHAMARVPYFTYHADRFEDHSLLFKKSSRFLAVLPANRDGRVLYSHQGISFGGLIMAQRARFEDVQEMFRLLLAHLHDEGIEKLIYRAPPHPYQVAPREDDIIFLERAGARIVETKIHNMVRCVAKAPRNKGWKNCISRSVKSGLQIRNDASIDEFWPMIERLVREVHRSQPVHSLDEIKLLKSRLGDDMPLLTAHSADGALLGGHLFLRSPSVLTAMYIGESPDGRDLGAGRFTLHHLLTDPAYQGIWLDLGQLVNPANNEVLDSLLSYKEAAGSRVISRHTWEIETAGH